MKWMNLWKFMDFQSFKKIKKWKKTMKQFNKKFLNILKKHRLKLIKREKNNF